MPELRAWCRNLTTRIGIVESLNRHTARLHAADFAASLPTSHLDPATQIIIVRHGETTWNLEGRHQGHLDSPLTKRGVAQAEALAARLGNEEFAALYSSDLGRALATAEIIGTRCGKSVVIDARLRERNLGIFH